MKTIASKNSVLFIVLFLFAATLMAKSHHDVSSETRNLSSFNAIHNSSSADLIVRQGDVQSVVVKSDKDLIPYIKTQVRNNTLFISIDKSFYNIDILEVQITIPELKSIEISGSGDFRFANLFSAPYMSIKITGSGDLKGEVNVDKMAMNVIGSGDVRISGIHNELKIQGTGSGDIAATDLNINECSVDIKGSGDIVLSGSTSSLIVRLKGSGDLDAYELNAVKVDAIGYGSGDMKLFASKVIKASLNGSGDIYYRGNASKAMVSENGSGEVYRR